MIWYLSPVQAQAMTEEAGWSVLGTFVWHCENH